MQVRSVMAASVFALLLGGCAGHNQAIGGLGGAAVGGLVGAQFGSGHGQIAAATAGALIGGVVGSGIGASLDEAERLRHMQAQQQAAQAIAWNQPTADRPGGGSAAGLMPPRYPSAAAGQHCREYWQDVMIDGRPQASYGTACRNADGSWQIQ